jgi:hypothetical protein
MREAPWFAALGFASLARTLLLPECCCIRRRKAAAKHSTSPRWTVFRRFQPGSNQPGRTTFTSSPLASPPPPTRSFSTRKACSL